MHYSTVNFYGLQLCCYWNNNTCFTVTWCFRVPEKVIVLAAGGNKQSLQIAQTFPAMQRQLQPSITQPEAPTLTPGSSQQLRSNSMLHSASHSVTPIPPDSCCTAAATWYFMQKKRLLCCHMIFSHGFRHLTKLAYYGSMPHWYTVPTSQTSCRSHSQ